MKQLVVALGILCWSGAVNAAPPDRGALRPAWEWTDEERIAARCDHALAMERIRVSGAAARITPGKLVDIIDGRRNPELFLSGELFELVVSHALIVDKDWQEAWADGVRSAGLPPEFWTTLEALSGTYLVDLREDYRLASLDGDVPEQERLAGKRAALAPTLCREQSEALAKAREMFGPSLDRFLYTAVAAVRTSYFDKAQDREALFSLKEGCR